MTREEWASCAVLLAQYYPTTFKLDKAQMQAWYAALADLDGERVLASVMHVVRTKAAFPSVADIRGHAEAGALTAATAWASVSKAIGRVGRYRVPEWEDPRIAVAVDALGGWEAICDMPLKDVPTARAQFRQAFEGAGEVEIRRRTFECFGVPLTPPAVAIGTTQSLKELLPGRNHDA